MAYLCTSVTPILGPKIYKSDLLLGSLEPLGQERWVDLIGNPRQRRMALERAPWLHGAVVKTLEIRIMHAWTFQCNFLLGLLCFLIGFIYAEPNRELHCKVQKSCSRLQKVGTRMRDDFCCFCSFFQLFWARGQLCSFLASTVYWILVKGLPGVP